NKSRNLRRRQLIVVIQNVEHHRRRSASVEGAKHGAQTGAGDAVRASLVAEDWPPSARSRFLARLISTICDGARAGDDHDTGTESDRTGQRDSRVVINRKVAAREKNVQRINNFLSVRGMIGASDAAIRR